jgi:TorA maturation chaperone TorD
MRDAGLNAAVQAAGGVGLLARGLGISQPAVSAWSRIPADRVLGVEALTGIRRETLRPDLYPSDLSMIHPARDRRMTDRSDAMSEPTIDEVDLARSHEYGMLALLTGREPGAEVLAQVARLTGDASPLGMAHVRLAQAAAETDPRAAGREFFRLFVGVGRGEILPYASYYLTGFVHERPLARVREDLKALGIERSDAVHEPEDHIAILCEIMAGIVAGRFSSEPGTDKRFFQRHLEPWADRLFADIEMKAELPFYRALGAVGRAFIEIEAEAFTLDD